MKKTVLTFGLISGVVSSLMMLATLPFMHRIGYDKGLSLRYTGIVLLASCSSFSVFVRIGKTSVTAASLLAERFP